MHGFIHRTRNALLIFIVGLLAACGADPNEGGGGVAVEKLGALEYLVLDRGTLQASAAGIAGTGAIIFRDPRPDEDSNFAVNFALQTGGSLSLVANANDSLQSGVEIKFSRGAADALVVTVIDGAQVFDVTEDFAGQKADAPISLSVDVHGHGHLIVFKGGEEFEYAFSTRPKGRLWGLKLAQAAVTSAAAAAPIDAH